MLGPPDQRRPDLQDVPGRPGEPGQHLPIAERLQQVTGIVEDVDPGDQPCSTDIAEPRVPTGQIPQP